MLKLQINNQVCNPCQWLINPSADINNSIVHCINKYCKSLGIEPVSIVPKDKQIFVTYNQANQYDVMVFKLEDDTLTNQETVQNNLKKVLTDNTNTVEQIEQNPVI